MLIFPNYAQAWAQVSICACMHAVEIMKEVPVVAILIVKMLRWRVLPDDSCQLLAVFTNIPREVFQAPPVNGNAPVLSHMLCTQDWSATA